MPTAELRYTAFAVRLNPGQTRVLHCDYGASLAGRTFAAVLDDIDLGVSINGTVVDIVFGGADTEDLSTRTSHQWFLYDITSGDDPLQIEFGGPVFLSTRGTELPDASVVVTSRDITVNVTVLGEPGPAGPGSTTDLAYTASPTEGTVTSSTGTDATVPVADGTNAGLMAPAQVTKLADIAAGAQVNEVTQAELDTEASTRSAADTALDGRLDTLELLDPVLEGDSRLTDARTPTAHAVSHQDGGTDELALAASQVFDFATAADARITAMVVKAFVDALGVDAATLDGETVASLTTAITAAIVDAAPGTLDTLNELAAALGDDPNFATTITNLLAGKAAVDASNITAATWRTALDVLSTSQLSATYVSGFEWDGDSYEAGAISVYVSEDPPDNSVGNDGDVWIPTTEATPLADLVSRATADSLYVAQATFAEDVEDRVGAMVADSATIDATYNDGGGLETLDVIGTTWGFSVPVLAPPKATVGTWPITPGGAANDVIGAGYRYNSSNAQNNQIDWDIYLPAGTWELWWLHVRGNFCAIGTWYLGDGAASETFTSLGTIDCYVASGTPSYNNEGIISGIVVASTVPRRTLRLKAATRNASAVNWFLYLQGLALRRTA